MGLIDARFSLTGSAGRVDMPILDLTNSTAREAARVSEEAVSPVVVSDFVRGLSTDLLSQHINGGETEGVNRSNPVLQRDCAISMYGTPPEGIQVLGMPVTNAAIGITIPSNRRDIFNALPSMASAGREQGIAKLASSANTAHVSFMGDDGHYVEYSLNPTVGGHWQCDIFDTGYVARHPEMGNGRAIISGTAPKDPQIDFPLTPTAFNNIRSTTTSILDAFSGRS